MTEISDDTVTRADRLEADCRQAMAAHLLYPPTWEHRAERRENLEWIDCLLDAWLDEVR